VNAEPPVRKRLQVIVSGRVQGVGFREFVRHAASSRGFTGFVRNGDDGRTVEVVAEGDEEALTAFLEVLGDGPRFSRVEHIDFTWSDATEAFSRFSAEM
jgi:acylphosphatase